MDTVLQVIIVVLSLSYKLLLAKDYLVGWIVAALTASVSCVYLIVFKDVPILACLELAFCFLNLYGFYKQVQRKDYLTQFDAFIISTTAIVIVVLVARQIDIHTVWYAIASSVSFLAGVVFLAQKNIVFKVTGWILYIVGCVTYAIVVYHNKAYGLVFVNIASTFLCMYGIAKEVKKARSKVLTAHFL